MKVVFILSFQGSSGITELSQEFDLPSVPENGTMVHIFPKEANFPLPYHIHEVILDPFLNVYFVRLRSWSDKLISNYEEDWVRKLIGWGWKEGEA